MAENTNQAQNEAVAAEAQPKPASSGVQSPTLPQIAADARAKAVESLEKILQDLPDPGDSGDLHLAGTRGQLQHCINLIKLFPANA